jgi:predicted dehydrogenase
VHISDSPTEVPEGPIRISVVGCGYWGPKMVRNFHQLPGAELVAVCDLREDRLAHMRELYPQILTVRSYEELLQFDLDAIAIATPVGTHYALARAALERDKHILVEKPITATSTQATGLIRLAQAKDCILMVGHTFEYNPAVEVVKQVIASGELGEIYYVDCIRASLGLFQPDIDVVWDLAPHDISILNYVLDLKPVAVSARGETYVRPETNLHEIAYLTVSYPQRILANVRVSWLDPVKTRRMTFVGSQRMLVYDDVADNKVVIYDKGAEVPPHSDTVDEFHMSYRHGGETIYPVTWVEPLRIECQHFLDCIRTNGTPRSSGEIGLQVVRVLEAARRSLLNGGVRESIES